MHGRRLTTVPVERETPADLVARLREIDPTTELLSAGDDQWWLGSVTADPSYTAVRRQTGERLLRIEGARVNANPRNVLLARLLTEGWVRIALYRCAGDPSQEPVRDEDGDEVNLVADFAARDWLYRHGVAASIVAAKLRHNTGEAGIEAAHARIDDDVLSDARAEYRNAVRGRRFFTAPAQTFTRSSGAP